MTSKISKAINLMSLYFQKKVQILILLSLSLQNKYKYRKIKKQNEEICTNK